MLSRLLRGADAHLQRSYRAYAAAYNVGAHHQKSHYAYTLRREIRCSSSERTIMPVPFSRPMFIIRGISLDASSASADASHHHNCHSYDGAENLYP
ncbi:hypothetical protein GBA52_014175 [Prunus armeniaca]|nr:hypothetical protein GBA52_014175 [Prunus armeniaca]